ncbi:hypothetical protein JQC75_08960 [Shewanella litorisediminis]|uniref:Uncharacterized protein n=1 Tax=Shewanella litorisediminis TaxID=1173586 RepID=A0ABX7G877_9GAMM|nr:hypothetical protein JQC75_08960 [Shewanella litorisediminis]
MLLPLSCFWWYGSDIHHGFIIQVVPLLYAGHERYGFLHMRPATYTSLGLHRHKTPHSLSEAPDPAMGDFLSYLMAFPGKHTVGKGQLQAHPDAHPWFRSRHSQPGYVRTFPRKSLTIHSDDSELLIIPFIF